MSQTPPSPAEPPSPTSAQQQRCQRRSLLRRTEATTAGRIAERRKVNRLNKQIHSKQNILVHSPPPQKNPLKSRMQSLLLFLKR